MMDVLIEIEQGVVEVSVNGTARVFVVDWDDAPHLTEEKGTDAIEKMLEPQHFNRSEFSVSDRVAEIRKVLQR